MKKININKNACDFIYGSFFMIIGCIFYALGVDLFLAPNEIVTGGISGASTLIHIFYPNIPIGLISIVFNIPILISGLKCIGWKFIIKCILTILVLGLTIDLFSFLKPITSDYVLASLYGGVFEGIGIGLFIKFNFSSGGTELLGRLIAKLFKIQDIPIIIAILDGIIVIIGAVCLQKVDNLLFALIVVFVTSKVSEVVLMGVDKSKLCIIISNKGEEISKELIKNSPRGVTLMDGKGMYSNNDYNVLLTCVKSRQVEFVKKTVSNIDDGAFVIISDSNEVRGKGFLPINKKN